MGDASVLRRPEREAVNPTLDQAQGCAGSISNPVPQVDVPHQTPRSAPLPEGGESNIGSGSRLCRIHIQFGPSGRCTSPDTSVGPLYQREVNPTLDQAQGCAGSIFNSVPQVDVSRQTLRSAPLPEGGESNIGPGSRLCRIHIQFGPSGRCTSPDTSVGPSTRGR